MVLSVADVGFSNVVVVVVVDDDDSVDDSVVGWVVVVSACVVRIVVCLVVEVGLGGDSIVATIVGCVCGRAPGTELQML